MSPHPPTPRSAEHEFGITEEQLTQIYPNELEISYDKYNQFGRNFTFVPKDAADRGLRMLFISDGKKIVTFRTGKLPEVEYVEGCL